MVSNAFRRVPPPSHSIGRWLPKDRAHVKTWLAKKLDQFDRQDSFTLDPSIIALEELVAASPYLTSLSRDMFIQIPPAYKDDPTGKPQVRDFKTMLGLVNIILKEGPQWFYVEDQTAMGLIGFPINAILDWPMGTLAGYIFFVNPEVNIKWHGILKTWAHYLSSPKSVECLNEENGWLSSKALEVLAAKGNDGETKYTFQQLYACNPKLPHFGFTSWDDFFTRKFNPGIRPIAYPDDQPAKDHADPTQVIVNACESAPLGPVAKDVQLHDIFWLKQQSYSLVDMLDNDPSTKQFEGGSVYQAFLSALSYHCWHAPVSGKVVGIRNVAGTYYSETLDQGFGNRVDMGPDNPDGADPNAPNNSQAYITAVAARGVIFIEANNKDIGLMAIVFVGMAEVSSCEFTVRVGQSIKKGDPIGQFHFGGSTHCLVFRPSTNLAFVEAPPDEENYPVCSELAVVKPAVKLQTTG